MSAFVQLCGKYDRCKFLIKYEEGHLLLKRFDLEIGICEKSVFEHKKMDKNDLELLRHYNVKQWNNEDFQDELILKYSKWVISKNRDMFLKGLGGGSFEIPEMYEFVFSGGKVHIEIGGGGYAGRKFKKNNDGSYDEEIIISRIYYTDHNNKYDSINVNATIAEALAIECFRFPKLKKVAVIF
jgi:hypothetical protein